MSDVDSTKTKLGHVTHLECLSCGEVYTLERLKKEQGSILVNVCYDVCFGPLDIKYDYDKIKGILTEEEVDKRPDTFWKLKELLPIDDIKVSREQPFTPLVESKVIGKELGIKLFLKLDCDEVLPTRSFKDRPVTLAFNKALEVEYKTVYVASTGNLAVSSAYFAKETGIKPHVYIPKSLGEIKKKAIRKYLPNPDDLKELDLSYDDCNIQSMNDCDKENEESIKTSGRKDNFVPNNSFRPYYKEGSKTSGIEIALQLNKLIGKEETVNIFYPLGSGALFCSAYKGINELKKLGLFHNPVKMWGIQPEICSPIIDAIGKDDILPVKNPKTIAKSIAIGKPGSGHQALDVIKQSNGGGFKVTEKDITRATIDLFLKEGVFAQFVGGVTIAGIIKAAKLGIFKENDVVVANITGTGIGRIEDDLLASSKEFGFEEDAKKLLGKISIE
jgi:threonine synthase|tara:strand:- start:736 stop:2070 length:1335 start_codon:yes stop_codon:yes gene_type:complete